MTILGLNAYHAGSAACLIVDGKLVAAAEEERFRRMPHWAGLPTQAIDYCLSEARLNLRDVEHIAINRKPGVNNLRRLAFAARRWLSPQLMLREIRQIRSVVSAKETLEQTYRMDLKAEIHHVEHHLAHLASAFLVSGFEEAACLSVDGFGDFASTAFGFGSGQNITISKRIYFPHSLGIFYSALTQYLGFPHYGDEDKVMGLAPYGEPNLIEPLRQVLKIQTDGMFRLNLEFFRHHTENVSYTWKDCTPAVGLLYKSALIDLLGPARQPNEPLEQKHKDLARSIQVTYEKAFFALLHAVHKQHPCSNLALAGGCAMNSVANGKVYRRTPFTRMYLPAAGGDAGGAIGAAVYVHSQLGKVPAAIAASNASLQRASTPEVGAIDPNRPASTEEEDLPLLTQSSGGDPVMEESNPSPVIQSPESQIPIPELSTFNAPSDESAGAESKPSVPNKSSIRNPQSEIVFSASSSQLRTSAIPSIPLRPLTSAYLGPESTEQEIHALLDWKKQEIAFAGCVASYISHEEELTRRTAQAIADGKVIGWFQGRMEWGPRALGNRSILADPRRADMKDILNVKIKRRESFRPFAPSILREAVTEWFEQDDDVPFMMEVFQIRAQKRSFIPAVTHVDGSGRLQTVHKETNPRYHRLIEQFRELTGIPMVLNTSFNENEPVVCYPEEALDCFLRTKMDVLVLGNFWIERPVLTAT